MIKQIELISILKKTRKEDESLAIPLWPVSSSNKNIKIKPNFEIYGYKIRLKTISESSDIKLVINGFESYELSLSSINGQNYVFESNVFKASYFLGFNLGFFEIHLHIDGEVYAASTLINEQPLVENDGLEYMYECISGSDFFTLFVLNYTKGNTLASEKRNDTDTINFWLSISIARHILREVNKFFSGELELTNRVERESVVQKYDANSVVGDSDISWLMDNPNELTASSEGGLAINGVRYEVENISQSKMIVSFDTYENRLLLSCLYSIKVTLLDLSDDFKGVKRFPYRSIIDFIQKTSECILTLNKSLQLQPPYNERPDFSNKYLGDSRYTTLYSLIIRWYAINKLMYGEDIRTPILGVTEVFEHYCFVKIIECLNDNGFSFVDAIYETSDAVNSVRLSRGDEIVSVYYEPSISDDNATSLLSSKKAFSPYRPDFVLTYELGQNIRCGVIDAKFSGVKQIKQLLGKEIYYKYGLYLHKNNNDPIDYVFAMYPSGNEVCDYTNERRDDFSGIIKPSLGYFSIPFSVDAAAKMSSFLLPMITGVETVA